MQDHEARITRLEDATDRLMLRYAALEWASERIFARLLHDLPPSAQGKFLVDLSKLSGEVHYQTTDGDHAAMPDEDQALHEEAYRRLVEKIKRRAGLD